jgi:hypothetical protein
MTDGQQTAFIGGYEPAGAYCDLVDGRFVPEHLCIRNQSKITLAIYLLLGRDATRIRQE